MTSHDKLARRMFANLLQPHLHRLYRLAYRLTSNQPDAEDLLQQVLVKLYQRAGALTEIENLGTWLTKVLYNHFIDNQRKFAKQRLQLVTSHEFAENPDLAPGTHQQPDALADTEFDITRLQTCLDRLSDDHRAVILMHDAEGYKLSEIAEITNTSIGTIKSRLFRARERLREMFHDGTF